MFVKDSEKVVVKGRKPPGEGETSSLTLKNLPGRVKVSRGRMYPNVF
jgi:hypothetical protein